MIKIAFHISRKHIYMYN